MDSIDGVCANQESGRHLLRHQYLPAGWGVPEIIAAGTLAAGSPASAILTAALLAAGTLAALLFFGFPEWQPANEYKRIEALNSLHADKSAAAELQEQFDTIERGILMTRQRCAATADTTSSLAEEQQQLDHWKQVWRDPNARLSSLEPIVSVVSVVSSADESRDAFDKRGQVEVQIDYCQQPVILVLCNDTPVKWHLDVRPGSSVPLVVLLGTDSTAVAGVPSCRLRKLEKYPGFETFTNNSFGPRYLAFTQALQCQLRLVPTTFQGLQFYNKRPFVVGPSNREWKAMFIKRQMRGLLTGMGFLERSQKMVATCQLEFPAVLTRELATGYASKDVLLLNWTPNGLESCRNTLIEDPSAGGGRFCLNPTNDEIYCLDYKISVFNRKSENLREIELPRHLQGLEYISAACVDTRRNQLIMLCGIMDKALYSYDLKSNHWKGLARFPYGSEDGHAGLLAYCAEDDCIYMVKGMDNFTPVREISCLNPQGEKISTVKLSSPLLTCCSKDEQLICQGDYLIVYTTEKYREHLGAYITVFNRRSGELVCRNNFRERQAGNLVFDEVW
jgi:hypothetical protein